MQCAVRWFFHSNAELEKEEIGGAEVFSPGEWMFCSQTGRIIKTGAKTGLDYKGSTEGRNTLVKLENKWKLLLKRQFRKEKILLNKECSFELKLNSFKLTT